MKVLFEFKVKKKYLKFFLYELDQIKIFAQANKACSLYEVVVKDESVFVLEEWCSKEHLVGHRSSSLLQSFRQKIGFYLNQPRVEYLLTPI